MLQNKLHVFVALATDCTCLVLQTYLLYAWRYRIPLARHLYCTFPCLATIFVLSHDCIFESTISVRVCMQGLSQQQLPNFLFCCKIDVVYKSLYYWSSMRMHGNAIDPLVLRREGKNKARALFSNSERFTKVFLFCSWKRFAQIFAPSVCEVILECLVFITKRTTADFT